MSVPVSLLELREVAAGFGSTPYLLTVGADATPHATSVAVAWSGDLLVAGAGRRTAGNVRSNDQVALLWPAPRPGDFALIVDGWADLRPGPGGSVELVIRPASAILHVTRQAPPAAPGAEGGEGADSGEGAKDAGHRAPHGSPGTAGLGRAKGVG
jgi:hypothetical protein